MRSLYHSLLITASYVSKTPYLVTGERMCVGLRILRSSLYGETICLHTYQDTYLLRDMHEIDSLCRRVRGADRDTTYPP